MRKPFCRIGIFVLLLASPALSQEEEISTSGEGGKRTVFIPPATKQKLLALFPDKTRLGAEPQGEPVYYGANLYEYIDGGAEVYHLFEFSTLIHQEYKAREADVTVDLYDLKNPLNAYGIYAAERSPAYHFIPMGAEGYVSDYALNFLQGPYYVKLSAFTPEGKADKILEAFARGISEKIVGGKDLPEIFNLFPRQNRAPRSEKFVRKAPLGHEFLSPAFQVTYKLEQGECTLLLSETGDATRSAERVTRLKEHFQKAGKVADAPAFGPGALKGSSSFEGEMFFLGRKKYLAILVNPQPGSDALFAELLAKTP
jgi:hypothetical protein